MPSNDDKDASLPTGRKQTDQSLSAERAKTDASLAAGRLHAEQVDDASLSSTRAEADETRSQARLDVDESTDTVRAANEEARDGERSGGDHRLRKERQAADLALDAERQYMDAVLDHERHQMRAVEARRFQIERKETDKNLSHERKQTDAAVERVATGLAEEKDAHLATQVALTSRDEFLAIVSHDLKNPLGSIAMVADVLASSPIYANGDEETRQYIDMIGRNAGETLRLIGDLLDMERMATGKLGLQIERHDLTSLIAQTTATFALKASTKGLELITTDEAPALFIDCDRGRICQVLSNLLSNAIKFTPSGGTVTVRVQPGATEVTISVADTGPGIAEDLQKKIFERLWQIHQQDRRGMGLGLYISKMLVEAHGGRIWVDTAIGQGSTFNVTLPVAAAS